LHLKDSRRKANATADVAYIDLKKNRSEAFGKLMKGTIKLFALGVMLAVFAVPALAQDNCTDEKKAEMYKTFLPKRTSTDEAELKIAADNARAYLKCTTDPSEQIAAYLKKWLDKYDAQVADQQETLTAEKLFKEALAKNNYADEVKYGKQLLKKEPDNPYVNIVMGIAGTGDESVLSDSVPAAKHAIELIGGGKPFAPAISKDAALAFLNWTIAKATAKTSPTEAIPIFIKAAKFESPLKKDARIYNELAAAYAEQVDKLTTDYKPFVGKPETTESKLVLANLNQAMDAQIDALARAAALAAATDKPALMERLTDVYKFRTKSTNGLNELVAGILSKPLPDQPKPITELPATSSSNSVSNGATNGSSGTSETNNGGKPVGNNLTSTTGRNGTGATGMGTAKPTASPTPQIKKPR
jgi:hypothetical protein